MLDIHPDGELAPRDIVSRGVFGGSSAGRGAFLDAQRPSAGIFLRCSRPSTPHAWQGHRSGQTADPVTPAVHYHMGRRADGRGGAYLHRRPLAAGEVTSTGVHGANRLASNSLLEAVVFAARIAENIKGSLPAPKLTAWGDNAGENDDPVTSRTARLSRCCGNDERLRRGSCVRAKA